jgi:hypothetical protein
MNDFKKQMMKRAGILTESKIRKLEATHDAPTKEQQEIDLLTQFLIGTAVELAHTDDPAEATRIAINHLHEDPHYYANHEQGKLVAEDLKEIAEPLNKFDILNIIRNAAEDVSGKTPNVVGWDLDKKEMDVHYDDKDSHQDSGFNPRKNEGCDELTEGDRVCAWCKKGMGSFDGDGVTHGICPSCQTKWKEDLANRDKKEDSEKIKSLKPSFEPQVKAA